MSICPYKKAFQIDCCKDYAPGMFEGEPCCYDLPKAQKPEQTFEEAIVEARNEFVEFIWANHANDRPTRTAAESLLIMYDQMRDIIKNLHK